ncbi:MAG: DUF2179 domain-containing protein [Candidatus Omnitrophica bacterium]|nr:DUF2179 domain-containing protein [Candidatus Omnitrophota bacterium]
MTPEHFIDSEIFTFVIIPLLIFAARACDVTLQTVRIMLLSKGKRLLAPALGFVEILIWLMAIRQVFHNLSNIYCYIGYAGGFAMGNFVGMYLEERLAFGIEVVRIVTQKDASELVIYLRSKGYGVTSIDAQGASGHVNVIFTTVNRCHRTKVVDIIKRFNPKAFYTIEDVRAVSEGVFLPRSTKNINILHSARKGK